MTRRSWVAGVVSVAVVAVVLVLTGGGDRPRLSAAQLRTAAGDACASGRARTDRIPTPATPTGADAFLRSGIPALRGELALLRSLPPPAELAARYGRALDAFASKLSELENAERSLAAGGRPVSMLSRLEQQLAPILAGENRDWRSLRIARCLNS